MRGLNHQGAWYYRRLVWTDICNEILPLSEPKANEQALARKGKKDSLYYSLYDSLYLYLYYSLDYSLYYSLYLYLCIIAYIMAYVYIYIIAYVTYMCPGPAAVRLSVCGPCLEALSLSPGVHGAHTPCV